MEGLVGSNLVNLAVCRKGSSINGAGADNFILTNIKIFRNREAKTLCAELRPAPEDPSGLAWKEEEVVDVTLAHHVV